MAEVIQNIVSTFFITENLNRHMTLNYPIYFSVSNYYSWFGCVWGWIFYLNCECSVITLWYFIVSCKELNKKSTILHELWRIFKNTKSGRPACLPCKLAQYFEEVCLSLIEMVKLRGFDDKNRNCFEKLQKRDVKVADNEMGMTVSEIVFQWLRRNLKIIVYLLSNIIT